MRPNHLILAAALTLSGSAAFAQSADQAALQTQIAELKKMLEMQNKKIADLETAVNQKASGVSPETQANINALNAKVSSMDKKLDQSGKFTPKETKYVEKLTFMGRIQPQFDWLQNETTNVNGSTTRRASTERFYLRRLYLGAEADLGSGFSGTLNINIANNPGPTTAPAAGTNFNTFDADIEKAIVSYKFQDSWKQLDQIFSLGYQKVPFGVEETTSSSKIKSVERSLSNRFWAEGGSGFNISSRHSGVFLSGDLPEGFSYSLAFANPDGYGTTGEYDRSTPDTNKMGYYARFEKKGEITSGVLAGKYLIGADLAFQDDVAIKGGTSAAATPGSTISAYGVHANYSRKFFDRDFSITGEFLTGNVDNGRSVGVEASPVTWMIEPTYFIDLDKKWEAVFRYSGIDTDGKGYVLSEGIRRAPSSGVLYDTLNSYYLGVNYYFKGDAVKLSAGYEFATGEDRVSGGVAANKKDEISGLRVRAQILF